MREWTSTYTKGMFFEINVVPTPSFCLSFFFLGIQPFACAEPSFIPRLHFHFGDISETEAAVMQRTEPKKHDNKVGSRFVRDSQNSGLGDCDGAFFHWPGWRPSRTGNFLPELISVKPFFSITITICITFI